MSAPLTRSTTASSTSTKCTSTGGATKPKEAVTSGIPLTKFRSLEPAISPAAPLARILSGPRDDGRLSPQSSARYPNYPGSGTLDDPYLVDWLPGERANPYNWATSYRWAVTAVVAFSCLCISFASSSYSAAIPELEEKFGMSSTVAILGLSLYVVGFGLGPLFWAPLSEIYGRNFAFLVSYPVFAIFNMVGAVGKNTETILISRFLAGTFGSSPITNAGGQISDMWAAHERAFATSLFSLAPFLGPVLGPIVGGFVAQNCGYRWVFWVQFIFAGVMFILCAVLVPETYAPTLLRRKAKRLQAEADAAGTGEHFIAKYDKVKYTKIEVLSKNLVRPFQLLFRELIVACLGIYAAIIYGTLYLFFEAFPIVFRGYRGWSLGLSGLAFTGIGIGLVLGNCVTPIFTSLYNKAVARAKARGEKVAPEARLVGCAAGAVLLPIGLFWFAWTSSPNVHWIVPIIASVPFGTGFLLIFTGIQLYLIDAYALFAASALASNAVLRAVFGAVFPLFSNELYERLGLNWAGTLIAFLALACTPMPFLFYRYGHLLRRNSRYAPWIPPTAESEEAPKGKVPQPDEASALEPEYAPDAGEHAGDDEKRIRAIV